MTKGIAFIFILLSIILQILALIFGKLGALQMEVFSISRAFSNGYYLSLLLCLALQAICWPLVLTKFPLFWSYMLMSSLYIAIPPISYFYFNETVSYWNIVGAAVIMAGIVVMLYGGEKNDSV